MCHTKERGWRLCSCRPGIAWGTARGQQRIERGCPLNRIRSLVYHIFHRIRKDSLLSLSPKFKPPLGDHLESGVVLTGANLKVQWHRGMVGKLSTK